MTDFLFPTARAAALSTRLLTASSVERLLAAKTADESFRLLTDLAFAGPDAEIPPAENFEKYLFDALFSVKKMIFESVDSPAFLKILFLPFDLQNAKSSLSAFFRGEKYENIRRGLSDFSFFPKRTAFEILFEKKSGPKFFEAALFSARDFLKRNSDDFRGAERLLDAAFFAEMARNVLKFGDAAVAQFFEKRLFLENQKTFSRAKKSEKIPFLTGKISEPMILVDRDFFAVPDDFSEIDAEISLLADLFWTARIAPDSPINVIFLFSATQKNAEVFRILFAGKRNGLSPERVRDAVAPFFPLFPKK